MPQHKITQGLNLRGSGVAYQIRAVTASETLRQSDHLIVVDATAGAVTLTLPPTATLGPGFAYQVRKTDSSANAVTVDANGAETIDGATTKVISQRWSGLEFVVGPSADQWFCFGSDPTGGVALAGPLYVGDTTSPKNVAGLTIDQGGNDDEALTLQSSTDVAQGFTTITETDTFGALQKIAGATGGLWIRGFGEATEALFVTGHAVTEDATRTTAADAPLYVEGRLKSGTTSASMSADKNLWVVANNSSARMILTTSGMVLFQNGVRPGTDAGAFQTVCQLFAGNGAPNNANGNNGDFYFRGDGGVGTNVYKKAAGAWGAIL